ncbi:PLP-dependent aminotransferase family protein [Rhodococcus sp. BP-252]|uniref:Aspartate aminotransferase n=1 Tax=Rhodococcoides kyotonense TaxID=398843 RepID=A0A177Y6X7_9NOCA|nr:MULTISPECIES: PLP-dependent aminotransferase family protein [Rhodococcus]MBY6413836.1 PLP-dependent aminotransferase family protein [Rhodococcus sp. BP-320]MBY6419256.1 PLP-dependent aminotransferase family protein [Rhodococcus sp. BP-321]MBY6424093.1 PLP-dependent aminotransferase family protein [Rhodococcus sp. BP-324]MBY6428591.1 PLP-dependent aminotransferase family protein [Rhodococcus sp. BP-323]MBY6434343.1 PLP-dependent aminotransferase family protein [Rhodococcus sp. BP-322]
MTTIPSLARRLDSVQSSAIRDLLALTARDDVISLAGGLPATELIPAQRVREAAAAVLSEPQAVQYGETPGWRGLREVIAGRESDAIGRVVDPSNVVVTHGSQQALTLVAQALVDPGTVVVVDEPAYTGALQVFSIAGADIHAIPIAADGMDTYELERRLAAGLRPALVHTVANFHNPRGVTMSHDKRAHLAALADRYGFWILEDDPYGEIWFDAPPSPPIAAHSDRVVRLSSASKILAPALRVGWMVAPKRVCDAVELLKQGADLCGSSMTQQMTAEMLSDTSWLGMHLERLRSAYGQRATALRTAVEAEFDDRVHISPADGGMFVWLTFRDGTDTTALLPTALENGVAFVPGRAFADAPQYSGAARLCFASSAEPVLQEAVRRLKSAHADTAHTLS